MLAYARAKLFDPLEIDTHPAYEKPVVLPTPLSYDTMSTFGWGTDAAGLHSACCLLRLRPVDMIKIGELYLNDGVWQGKQILPQGLGQAVDHRRPAQPRVRADVVADGRLPGD